jgi:hypothetical protein
MFAAKKPSLKESIDYDEFKAVVDYLGGNKRLTESANGNFSYFKYDFSLETIWEEHEGKFDLFKFLKNKKTQFTNTPNEGVGPDYWLKLVGSDGQLLAGIALDDIRGAPRKIQAEELLARVIDPIIGHVYEMALDHLQSTRERAAEVELSKREIANTRKELSKALRGLKSSDAARRKLETGMAKLDPDFKSDKGAGKREEPWKRAKPTGGKKP